MDILQFILIFLTACGSIAGLFGFVGILNGAYKVGTTCLILSMLLCMFSWGTLQNIQEDEIVLTNAALADYQNNNVSLIKYSEDTVYKDKIDELYQNELEINDSAGFWCRFNMNG